MTEPIHIRDQIGDRLRFAASGSPKTVALEWIPRPVRDLVYRLIARWRTRIRGRLESCPMPAAE